MKLLIIVFLIPFIAQARLLREDLHCEGNGVSLYVYDYEKTPELSFQFKGRICEFEVTKGEFITRLHPKAVLFYTRPKNPCPIPELGPQLAEGYFKYEDPDRSRARYFLFGQKPMNCKVIKFDPKPFMSKDKDFKI